LKRILRVNQPLPQERYTSSRAYHPGRQDQGRRLSRRPAWL